MNSVPTSMPQLKFQSDGQSHVIHLPPIENWSQRNGKWCFGESPTSATVQRVWVKQCTASDSQRRLLDVLRTVTCDFIPKCLCSENRNELLYYATEVVSGRELYDGMVKDLSFAKSVFDSPQLLCEVIKSSMHVLRLLNTLGHFYPDLASHNVMVDVVNSSSWIIDLDSCCLLGDELRGRKVFEGFSLILPSSVFPQHNMKVGTPLGSQSAVIGFSLVLARAYTFAKDGKFKEAKNLLTKELSWNGTSGELVKCLRKGNEGDLKRLLRVRTPLNQLMDCLACWRSEAIRNVAGDWDACWNVVNSLTESIFGISVHSKARQAALLWIERYGAIANGLDPFEVLDEWPKELDTARLDETVAVDGVSVHELVRQLRDARLATHVLMGLTDEWKRATDVDSKAALAGRICGKEGKAHHSLLHSSHSGTKSLIDRYDAIRRWHDGYTSLVAAIRKAAVLEELGELSAAIDLLDEYLPKWPMYARLQAFYQRLCAQRVPWDDADLRSRIESARAESRYERLLADLALLPPGRSTDQLRQESGEALNQARSYVSTGRQLIASGMLSEARTAFQAALTIVADCNEARVGLARTAVVERLSMKRARLDVTKASSHRPDSGVVSG